MRTIISGETKEAVKNRLDKMTGWTAVGEIKPDVRRTYIRYICVVENTEIEDKPSRAWGRKFHLR